MLYEEPCKIEMTPFRHLMERSRPTLVLDCYIGTVLDEESCKIKVTLL
jgi:hypothetical protein